MAYRPSYWSLPAVLCLAAACSSPPTGDSGGRLDARETTLSDLTSEEANVPDMLTFGDQVGEKLAQQIADIPAIRSAPSRVVLELGTIENRTRTPLSDFEMLQKRLHRAVQQSRFLSDRVMVVEPRERMQYEVSRVTGAAGNVAQYDPSQTYVLQGDFYETVRNNARRYWFNFQLTNLVSREIVFSADYEQGYLTP